jgi:hypothetical protein
VAIATEQDLMPFADPDQEQRILAFLTRLAEHDAALPPPLGAADAGHQPPEDGGEDGMPDAR